MGGKKKGNPGSAGFKLLAGMSFTFLLGIVIWASTLKEVRPTAEEIQRAERAAREPGRGVLERRERGAPAR